LSFFKRERETHTESKTKQNKTKGNKKRKASTKRENLWTKKKEKKPQL